MPDIPELIRELRRKFNENQETFALRIGVSESSLRHYEAGQTTPRPGTLMRLAQEGRGIDDNEFQLGINAWIGVRNAKAFSEIKPRNGNILPSLKNLAPTLKKIADRCNTLALRAPEESATGDKLALALTNLEKLLRREEKRFTDLKAIEIELRKSQRMVLRRVEQKLT